ncbi:hypothetical protein EG329_010052 [Mollisiaceae sp. DMI_Dod_QoI]|nr:hypothetical protein EG329_010052 [Helotiales sp. DMI_Dod_QoI]
MPPPASNEGNDPLVFPDINIPNPATLASSSVSSLIDAWMAEAERLPEWGYQHKMVVTLVVVFIGLVAFFVRRSQQYKRELEAMVKEAKSQ